jgi:predicted dehydrogenase
MENIMQNITQLNTAIIGFGKSAQVFHLPILEHLPHFNVQKVVKRSMPTSELLAEYPNVSFTCNIDEVMKDDDISLVVITTPNTSHYELCKYALFNNKHVVVEKPFTPSYDKCMELFELAKKQGRVLSVFHNRRFDGDFLTVKDIINKGDLGRIVEYESHFDRFRNHLIEGAWREQSLDGSGILFDLGSHLIDQALDLFGMPQTVFADVRRQRDNAKVDDNYEVILGYPRLKVTLKSTMLCGAPNLRFRLNGTNGSYIKYGVDPQEQALKTGQKIDDSWGTEDKENWGISYLMIGDNIVQRKMPSVCGDYRKYYIDIYNSIINQNTPLISGEDATRVIKIIQLCFKSNKLGKIVSVI